MKLRERLYLIKLAVQKRKIAREKKVKFGKRTLVANSIFEGRNAIGDNSRFNSSHIGLASYVNENCWINNATIGRFCSIAPFVKMGFGTHPTDTFVSTHPAFYYNTESQIPFTFHKSQTPKFKPLKLFNEKYVVEIGNDVWIGVGAIILDSVKIGDGAIIAAGAVVTKDVEPYTVVAGVPAKEIKKRFTEPQIEFLLKDRWWERDFDEIERHYAKYHNIEEYIEWQSKQ